MAVDTASRNRVPSCASEQRLAWAQSISPPQVLAPGAAYADQRKEDSFPDPAEGKSLRVRSGLLLTIRKMRPRGRWKVRYTLQQLTGYWVFRLQVGAD